MESPGTKIKETVKERQYIPQCCAEHRIFPQSCLRYPKKCVDSTRWKFPRADDKVYKRISAKRKEMQAKKIDSLVAEIESKAFKIVSSSLTSEDALELSNFLDMKENISSDGFNEDSQHSEVENVDQLFDIMKDTVVELEQKSFSQKNAYANLLDRIELEEKEVKLLDPETLAYKEIERHLDNLAEDFSKWTSCLVLPEETKQQESSPEVDSKTQVAIQPEKLRRLFQIDLSKPTLCPYIQFLVKEVDNKPRVLKMPKPNTSSEKEKKKQQQAYYLPPKMWFSHDFKQLKEPFTQEEQQFIQSFGVKSFLEYLKQKRKDPPKVLSDLMQKYKEHLRNIKESEKLEDQKKGFKQ